MLAVMANEMKRPEEYWKSEKFARRYVMNNVNNIRENPGTNLFNITAMMAILQGITYLCEKPTSILDVGCGHATRPLDIKAKLQCRVVGVDYSEPMLEQARNINNFLPEERRVELHKADADKMPFSDGEFDVCTTYGLFMGLPEPEKAAAEMMRVCRYGIVCIEETPDVMNDEQLEHYTRVKDKQFPGRVYWHNYARLFVRAGSRTVLFSPLPVPENWDLGQPPGYIRVMGAK